MSSDFVPLSECTDDYSAAPLVPRSSEIPSSSASSAAAAMTAVPAHHDHPRANEESDSLQLQLQSLSPTTQQQQQQQGAGAGGDDGCSSVLEQTRVDAARHRFPYAIVWGPLPILTWLIPCIGHLGLCDSVGRIHDFAGPFYISIDNFMITPTRYLQIDPEQLPIELLSEREQHNTSPYSSETASSSSSSSSSAAVAAAAAATHPHEQQQAWSSSQHGAPDPLSGSSSDGGAGAGAGVGELRVQLHSACVASAQEVRSWPRAIQLRKYRERWDASIDRADEVFQQLMHNLCCNNCHHHVGQAFAFMGLPRLNHWRAWWMVMTRGKWVSFGAFALTVFPSLIVWGIIVVLCLFA